MSNWGAYANNNERDNESDLSSYEDSEEEDLPPLQINSWGDNNVVARVNEEGTTEVDVSSNGWASLIDPNHKIGANGLGSGNLHRKGGNFRPVDEEYILNHRLKKGGLPKAPGSGKKKKKAAPVQSRGGSTSFGRNAGPPSRQGHRPAPPPSTTRRPPPQSRLGDGGATGWGSQKLADTPFWEQPAAVRNAPPRPAPAAAPPVNHQQPVYSSGAAASKYATGAAASRYAPQQHQQQQQQQQHHQQQQQQQQPAYNTPPPSAPNTSRYAPQQSYPPQQAPASMGSTSFAQYAPQSQGAPSTYMAPPQQQAMPAASSPPAFVSGSSASKYATGSSASKYAPQNGSSSSSVYASPSPPAVPPPQQRQQQQRQERKPILTFNIELVPGVSAPLNVYENSNPIELVDIFEREHNLHMQPVAKETFARNIETLVEHEMKKRYGS